MAYSSLEQALLDLERAGMLQRIKTEVDPYLEMAAIAREAYLNNGPALLFERVKGSPFRAAGNIFGTEERAAFLFRKTLPAMKTAIRAKASPKDMVKSFREWPRLPFIGLHALPFKAFSAPVLQNECTLADLPMLHSYPGDGGAFLTLPQVCTLPPDSPSIMRSNVGMYRIQIAGRSYAGDECGLHYQINRGIAKHHQKAMELGKPLKVSVFLGGPPAHTLAAAMPMPDNIPEMVFSGVLAGRSFRYKMHNGWCVSADADFCILGEVQPELKPEGPFGDHVGYYSAEHLFPYMKVKHVFHKKNAIFPFTVVGRPPSEDTVFGNMIHELVGPMVPVSVAGLHEMNAVDAAGVHPLLLAIGSERFVPYSPREPMELHKVANALLGFNQASLAKYLVIAAREDSSALSVRDVQGFFTHVLERLHIERDLHFQTSTTIDTLDYSGTSLNHGSKVIISAAGEPCRTLGTDFASDASTLHLPRGFSKPRQVAPGILAIEATPNANVDELSKALEAFEKRDAYPLITIADDSEFTAKTFDNWLWVTFTRSAPAQDVHGVRERIVDKHWTAEAPLIIDARMKQGYQLPLEMPDAVMARAKNILAENCRQC